jgi:hypothetical protein
MKALEKSAVSDPPAAIESAVNMTHVGHKGYQINMQAEEWDIFEAWLREVATAGRAG